MKSSIFLKHIQGLFICLMMLPALSYAENNNSHFPTEMYVSGDFSLPIPDGFENYGKSQMLGGEVSMYVESSLRASLTFLEVDKVESDEKLVELVKTIHNLNNPSKMIEPSHVNEKVLSLIDEVSDSEFQVIKAVTVGEKSYVIVFNKKPSHIGFGPISYNSEKIPSEMISEALNSMLID